MDTFIVLVHGYTGKTGDLDPLAARLKERYGEGAALCVSLPGHENGTVPAFDEAAFKERISGVIEGYQQQGKRIVLVGHSTGGSLIVSLLSETTIDPVLLILIAAPKKIDLPYLERWKAHRTGQNTVSFGDMAAAISFINRAGGRRVTGRFPVLVVHGTEDDLVPVADAYAWETGSFDGTVRTVLVPEAGHHLVEGAGSDLALDVIARTIADVVDTSGDVVFPAAIAKIESETASFLELHPLSARHLAASASGLHAIGKKPDLAVTVPTEPVIANIEITTRCNLSCGYCARAHRQTPAEDMSVERFRQALSLLPHAYRVTLVGLGEPLLHPKLAELISMAAKDGRRVGLVTNAMLLDGERSRQLLDAGLASIAFSIDAPDQALASELRPGTDLDRVAANIRSFTELSRTTSKISTAVFTAVSTRNIQALDRVVDLVTSLGVHVMMMTDLNFGENQDSTLWKNADGKVKDTVRTAVARAFTQQLPVLSVHGLEEFGLMTRYRKYLLLPPDGLFQRSAKRTWCCSPWQTIPVNVRGDVTVCDCQPDAVAGSILTQPFSDIWNGSVMKDHRQRMLSDDPPTACRLCPRF